MTTLWQVQAFNSCFPRFDIFAVLMQQYTLALKLNPRRSSSAMILSKTHIAQQFRIYHISYAEYDMKLIYSVIAWKSKKRHNFVLDKWISILKKLVMRTRVRTNFYRKNMPHFSRFMAKNDGKRFDWFKNAWLVWRQFWPWIVQNVAYFFDKRSCALEFL